MEVYTLHRSIDEVAKIFYCKDQSINHVLERSWNTIFLAERRALVHYMLVALVSVIGLQSLPIFFQESIFVEILHLKFEQCIVQCSIYVE